MTVEEYSKRGLWLKIIILIWLILLLLVIGIVDFHIDFKDTVIFSFLSILLAFTAFSLCDVVDRFLMKVEIRQEETLKENSHDN